MTEKVVIGEATLYRGDCMGILPELWNGDSIVTDPPYGINWDVNCARFSGGESKRSRKTAWQEKIKGDDKPFDPNPWLGFYNVIMFGANNYTLPPGSALVWVKKHPSAFGTFLSDAEIAYKKGGHGVYCYFDASFNGAGANFEKHHPNEKPVGVMEWCLSFCEGRVIDPYMGSGTTGVACANQSRPFIGIEIDKAFFDVACERIDAAQRQMRLAL